MGKLIAIEGLDGSGKDTQSKLLFSVPTEEGRAVRLLSFPDYESPSSTLVKMYLGGELGKNPGDVNAYAATMMFAADRYVSYKKDWGEFFADGDSVIIANRYTTSNAIHQASKLDENKRKEFFAWLEEYEYEYLRLPRPDRVFFLDLPVDIAIAHILSREEKTGVPRDIHEKDFSYIRACESAAKSAAEFYGWTRVEVARNGEMLSPDEIERKLVSLTMELDLIKERRY
jgi:dTMP kinase